jgi:hypothetical protein
VPVNDGRTVRMIEIIRVDMREGGLIEAQKQGDRAQNCAQSPHKYQTTLSDTI